jgi:hypothetical protein
MLRHLIDVVEDKGKEVANSCTGRNYEDRMVDLQIASQVEV